ncbi:NusB antitermination factor [Armatimonadetes bacterium GXS]|nr:NusB antitermination factor [Armatimonadetes bacterium GXS]
MNPDPPREVSPRRLAREWALRALYQIEVGQREAQQVIEEALEVAPLEPGIAHYMRELVNGVLTHQATELDPLIEQFAHGWTLDRMPIIDRNILRIALYELRYQPQIPTSVIVSEAVELAKRYSTAQSGRFVNGVLRTAARAVREAE